MIKNSFDLIDLVGPDATKQDYENIRDLAQGIIDDPEMWEEQQ